MHWAGDVSWVHSPEELWKQREESKSQEHRQHKQMSENVPEIQHGPGAGWQYKIARKRGNTSQRKKSFCLLQTNTKY